MVFSHSSQANFEKRGAEFTDWAPQDWQPAPEFLKTIKDPEYKQFGIDLHEIWKELGRKMIDDVEVSRRS